MKLLLTSFAGSAQNAKTPRIIIKYHLTHLTLHANSSLKKKATHKKEMEDVMNLTQWRGLGLDREILKAV